MATGIYIFHWITLGIYAGIACLSAMNIPLIKYAHNVVALKGWLLFGSVALFLQSTSFLWLQVDWVLNNRDDAVGEDISFAWLLFDYANGFALLGFVMALRVYLQWHHHPKMEAGHRRRATDP